MKALAGKWDVYYVEGEEDFDGEEMSPENTPWDELTIFIEPKNNEVDPGETKVLMVQAEQGYTGWRVVPWQTEIADYNKPLPTESYKYFIQAVFQEI